MGEKKESNWIWTEEWNEHHASVPKLVLFRRLVEYQAEPKKTMIQISADSRYKLYVNGEFVEVGPSKGDKEVWFLDEVDITSYLKIGSNVIAVIILRYPLEPTKGNQSIIVTMQPGLYFVGSGCDAENNVYEFSGDSKWKCRIDDRVKILPESSGFSPLHIYECMHENEQLWNWKEVNYDDIEWQNALPYQKQQIRDAVSPGNLNLRTIPFMYKKKQEFQRMMDIKKSVHDILSWENMLKEAKFLEIPAHTQEIVEIDAGEETTGYLRLFMEKGHGSEIKILQSESYVQDERVKEGNISVKGDRTDFANGHLEGYTDVYYSAGTGNGQLKECYEPFWLRTFRFIQLQITTKEEPIILHGFDYIETGYPLEIKTKVQTSDTSLTDIWDISKRTLQRCMHETYEDCPFYEQLQYVMDARSQILFTYAVSLDDRLARKCIDDLKRSQRYDGMLCSAYPNTKPNVIPGFSVFYILMLHDHMMYFGDKELIKYHMPSVESILYFFANNTTEAGYVGKIGGPHRQEKFWSFIDWAPQWISGVPAATLKGAITMESLLYLLGLQNSAELAEYIGRTELAAEYRKQADTLTQSIRQCCIGENGMVQDGPGVEEYSQHCQVFAILTNVLDRQTGKRNLLETITHKDKYAQCTVSMALYLYRALEKTDLYEYTDKYWDIWRNMISNHMTTCAESAEHCRSDCHAWGALALYELPAVILGVRPAAPGFGKVLIHPVPGYLTYAEGEVITPKGTVKVAWKKEDTLYVKYEVPEDIEVELGNCHKYSERV